jgi:N-acetylglutamate synthase-like GNAT family acetyltransferase
MEGTADPKYISHGEIQGGRAVDTDHWAPDLNARIKKELAQAVLEVASLWVAEALLGDTPIGFVLMEFKFNDSRYVIFHDMVMKPSVQDQGYEHAFADWLKKEMQDMKIQRAFFESGIRNHEAHKLFESFGFKTISVTMMLDTGLVAKHPE